MASDAISSLGQQEINEWLSALADVVEHHGDQNAQILINSLQAELGGAVRGSRDYVNTIPVEAQPAYPGDLKMERRIAEIILWNAAVMVVRANRVDGALGGHLATYASASTLYDVLFNQVAHAATEEHGGDCVLVQGHASPGIYARAFLEGRFSEQQVDGFRRELSAGGVSSYPHPHLMPTFWQFPTVSMGLGPIQAVYLARLFKYMDNRGLAKTKNRKVWAFCGDGEMAEPESLGSAVFAVRQQLNNLIFVINCNLQSLDGPVTGNTNIVKEMEGVFGGAGWHVIKVLWGSQWDPLFAKDATGILTKRLNECLDGDFQNFKANDGAYLREHFFGKYPELAALVADYSDHDLMQLTRGGHDFEKVFAAYQDAMAQTDKPTVILTMTVKGYGLGSAGESQNTAHNQKKMTTEQLLAYRDRLNIPVTDEAVEDPPFYHPGPDSEEVKYLKARRDALGGDLPARREKTSVTLPVPSLEDMAKLLEGTGDREISSNMAFVRVLSHLLKDENLKEFVVPIVPDECRTLAMEGLFKKLGIYSSHGQQYEPVDKGQLITFREDEKGQILNEGINEAGAFSSWLAAATSYSHSNTPLIPFYLFYSMFGFQRIGDLAWAAGDLQARGFLLGGLAGRTTLAGEGLQHTDGHALLMAATIPSCKAYDPAYAYEITVIIQDGLRRMLVDQENVYYYLTMMNEKYLHPDMPAGVEEGIVKGLYLLETVKPEKIQKKKSAPKAQLLGSAAILLEVRKAAQWLARDFGVICGVWSATSYSELRRDALACDHYNRHHPEAEAKVPYVTECLDDAMGPVIAASDYMKLVAEQIRAFIPNKAYHVLGTDGYGRSDSRHVLRDFFEVDARYIAFEAVRALVASEDLPAKSLQIAMEKYEIQPDKVDPLDLESIEAQE